MVGVYKFYRRIYEVPEASARYPNFTKHVETVTPPVLIQYTAEGVKGSIPGRVPAR
jgi:hypothetical protein